MLLKDEWRKTHWIGIDLDGTLAMSSAWPHEPDVIGAPIANMVSFVKSLVDNGWDVRLFTARKSWKGAIPHMKTWLKDNDIPITKITNVKDMQCACIFDDKAVNVVRDMGLVNGLGMPFVATVTNE